MAQEFSRRRFLKGAMVGAALIPLVNLDTHRALAADRVPENDPMAQALKYVEASPEEGKMCAATAPSTRKLRKLTGTRPAASSRIAL